MDGPANWGAVHRFKLRRVLVKVSKRLSTLLEIQVDFELYRSFVHARCQLQSSLFALMRRDYAAAALSRDARSSRRMRNTRGKGH